MIQKSPGVLLLAAVFLVNACKKDSKADDISTGNAGLEVRLNNQYMPGSKIDSAIAIWETGGQAETEKMVLSSDILSVSLKKFTPGNGRLTIQLYTKTKLGNHNLQWERRVDFSIEHSERIRMAGPANLEDLHWFPRIIMIDPPTGFTAIIALNPHDAYFLVKNIPPQWNKIELERGYYKIPGGAESVARGLWKCNNECTGVIENRSFFEYLPLQIGNRPWRMVEIGVALYNNTQQPGPGIYFNHTY
jgi:hypothetical protein